MSISSKQELQIQSAYQGVNFLEGFFFSVPQIPSPNTHIQISQVLEEICFECLYPESKKTKQIPLSNWIWTLLFYLETSFWTFGVLGFSVILLYLSSQVWLRRRQGKKEQEKKKRGLAVHHFNYTISSHAPAVMYILGKAQCLSRTFW